MNWRHRSWCGCTGSRCCIVPYFDLVLNCRSFGCIINCLSWLFRNGSSWQRSSFKRCLTRLCLVHVVKRRACSVTSIGEWRTSAVQIPLPSKLRYIHKQVPRVISILLSKHRRSCWPTGYTAFKQLRNTINTRLRMKISLPYLKYILHIVYLLDPFSWCFKRRSSYNLLFLTFVIPFEWHISFRWSFAIAHWTDALKRSLSLMKLSVIESLRRTLRCLILPSSSSFMLTYHAGKINCSASHLVRPHDAWEFFPSWKLMVVRFQFFLWAICIVFGFREAKTDFRLIELL